MKRTTIIAATTASALALAAPAQAHVTLQPTQAPADGYTRLDVRVPNEEDAKATTKVVVQMPPGFAGVSYEPVPGWRGAVARRKLATPLQTPDGPLTEEVARLTFTATGDGIAPGQFQDFGLSLHIPDRPAGTKLTFKALQTYAGGDVVRWIGAPDSDRPAPQVTLTPAADAAPPSGGTAATAGPAGDDDDGEDDDGGGGLVIAALVAGALGLLAGGAALVRARG
jgi:uncharacterized protein YcnI